MDVSLSQSINHGLTSSFLDKARLVSKQLFELPLEEKQKYAKEFHKREGYGNDIIFAEVLDWNDRLVPIISEALLINVGDQR